MFNRIGSVAKSATILILDVSKYLKKTSSMKKTLAFLIFILLQTNVFSQTVIEMEETNGIYKIDCKVNGVPMNFIFDTGASNVSISKTEASFLIKQGLITKEDIIGTINYQIANGEIHEGTKVNIKTIEIKGLTIDNVTATVVHEQNSPLLLGQSLLSRLGKISIDGNILTIHNSSSQISSNSNPLKFIDEVSNFTEVFAGNKMVHSSNISIDKSNGKVSILEKNDYGKKIDTRQLNFYTDDIINSGAKYSISDIGDGQFSVYLEISTKSKSVEWIDFNIEKGKEYLSITDKKYIDKIRVFANGNLISYYLAEKYIENWAVVLNLENLIDNSPKEQEKILKNFNPKLENNIGSIKLGQLVNRYSFIVKPEKITSRYKTNTEIKQRMKTHFVDLEKFDYDTFADAKIQGIYIDTTKESNISEIVVDLEYDKNLLNNLILSLGTPTFLGKGEHPDSFTYWENEFLKFVLVTHRTRYMDGSTSKPYHSIIIDYVNN